jgi:multidrug efflux system membrane fusion protein
MKLSSLKYFLVLMAAAVCIYACTLGQAQEDPSQVEAGKRVSVVQPEATNYVRPVYASGRLGADEDVKLSFKTGGIISRVHVQEGARVRRGQLLAELDLSEIRAQVQQAEAGLKQAELTLVNAGIALERAERDHRNVSGLFADSVATLEQKEDVDLALRAAQNQLEVAQQGVRFQEEQLAIAKFNLEHSSITAPSNGVIQLRLANPNELIGPGSPVFLFGTNEQQYAIRVAVTDRDVVRIRVGNQATIHFDAWAESEFTGTVQEIAGMADPYTSTYEVKILVDPQDKQLLPGFIGSVEIFPEETTELLMVPIDALVSADGSTGTLFVAEGGAARKVEVALAGMDQDRLLVRRGLSEESKVVVQGSAT